MKFLVFFLILGCAFAHNIQRRDAADAAAEIKEQHLNISPDGSFDFGYETGNGILAKAAGVHKDLGGNPPEVAESVQGSYQWVAPDGKTVVVTYTADENGYHPKVVQQ